MAKSADVPAWSSVSRGQAWSYVWTCDSGAASGFATLDNET
jgi:hypothetical protein